MIRCTTGRTCGRRLSSANHSNQLSEQKYRSSFDRYKRAGCATETLPVIPYIPPNTSFSPHSTGLLAGVSVLTGRGLARRCLSDGSICTPGVDAECCSDLCFASDLLSVPRSCVRRSWRSLHHFRPRRMLLGCVYLIRFLICKLLEQMPRFARRH